MASSREPSFVVDVTAGSLVWVRRRNGSWWPGCIVGEDELPEACLVPPKVGTPVRLLGKEDSRIDWYNLEKSRRVKAFRCGEFDECIERVKVFAAPANRINVKYARRDDAILHALELESSCKCSNLKDDDATRCQSQSSISCENSDHTNSSNYELSLSRKRLETPNDSEDEGNEGTKRMRGLQDLGLTMVPKQSPEAGGWSLYSVLPDNSSPTESDVCNSFSSCIPINSSRPSISPARRKNLKLDYHVHESWKRKCRRRPLTKVLEISSRMAVPLFSEQGLTEIKVSGLESLESDKTNSSVVINNHSDTSGTSVEKEATSLNACEPLESAVGECQKSCCPDLQEKVSCCESFLATSNVRNGNQQEDAFEIYFNAVGRQSFQYIQVESVELNDEELDVKSSTSFSVHPCLTICTEDGSAKRQLGDEKHLKGMSGSNNEISSSLGFEDRINPSDELNVFDHTSFDGLRVSDDCNQLLGGNHLLSHHNFGGGNQESFSSDELGVGPKSQKGHLFQHQSHTAKLLPIYSNCLYDVRIDVQASYVSEHAPLVSVMSKLNSRAVIGHQIAVQILEDGHCGLLTSKAYGTDYKKDRSYSMSGSQLQHSRKKRVSKKKLAKLKKKLAKLRKCGGFPQKMRKISSISFGTGHKEKARNTVVHKLSAPNIACVPLNVVFSRITKALNSSQRPPHSCMNEPGN